MKTEIEWIPVSEKLPRLEDDVLVTVRNKETGTSAVWSGVRYKNGWAISATSKRFSATERHRFNRGDTTCWKTASSSSTAAC